jgi:hypothetical protein
MAYVNTGIERAKTLTIDKKIGGVSLSGYPKAYSILDEFVVPPFTIAEITEVQFQQLTTEEYANRLTAFKTYIETEEGISDLDAITDEGTPAYQVNETSCPIGA